LPSEGKLIAEVIRIALRRWHFNPQTAGTKTEEQLAFDKGIRASAGLTRFYIVIDSSIFCIFNMLNLSILISNPCNFEWTS
jgi:hypothetical protein